MKLIKNYVLYPFLHWFGFFQEMRIWLLFMNKSKSNRELLEKNELRVDWIGRVYGVVNVPDEVLGAAEEIQQAYVLKEMGRFGSVMTELNLSNIVYPQMQEIKGSGAYLVIFWPVLDKLDLMSILLNILGSSAWLFANYIIIKLIMKTGVLSIIWDFIYNLL
jgi:hypothetical protein